VPVKHVGGGCGGGKAKVDAKPLDVLEVGSGTGWLLEKLNRLKVVRGLVGIEPSEAMRAYALKKFPDAVTDVSSAVELLKEGRKFIAILDGVAESLPFDGELFDRVVLFTSLEFVGDREKAVDEALRVLRPGGRVVIGVLSGDSLWAERRRNNPIFKDGWFPSWDEFGEFLKKWGGVMVGGAIYWAPDDAGRLPKTWWLKEWWGKLWHQKKAAFLMGYIEKR
jgi:SAM-dependent methyltransferase